MNFKVVWSLDANDELLEIVTFQREKYGRRKALEVYESLHERVLVTKLQPDLGRVVPELGRVVPELAVIGLTTIRELIQSPWRILYSVNGERIEILSIVDGRRNFEEILYRKVLDGKLS